MAPQYVRAQSAADRSQQAVAMVTAADTVPLRLVAKRGLSHGVQGT
jgi:hypothetical protein